ncbi:DUF2207 family protein [Leucobacter albus]|uniref:DUF2207 family protein n=1 Tax=Leucobacter albus TaxID=272210 RepID=A0ABW3TKN1_9MICO
MRKLPRIASLALASCALIAATLGVHGASAPAAHADTEDFSYETWHVAYEIDVDAAGTAVANVTETVAPRFPESDQNRGIVRGIPIDYQGASTNPRDFTVTDAAGVPVPFEVEDEDGFRIVLVGDDSFVHGLQTYVISYTMSNVVLSRDDGAADEFYWDIMDFEHLQPVGDFSAEVSFSPELAPALTGDARCYWGAPQSTAECSLEGAGSEADPLVLRGLGLERQQGVTVAVGLAPGTIAQPAQRLPNFALDFAPMFIGAAGLATGVTSSVLVGRFKRAKRTARGVVVPQYDVPRELPPLLAASLAGGALESPAPAQIVHLAVNGVTRLEDGEKIGKLSGRSKPTQVVRVVDPSRAVDALDRRALETLVPGGVAGDARTLPQKSTEFAEAMTALTAAGAQAAKDRGYLERASAPSARPLGIATLALGIVLIGFGIVGFVFRGPALPFLFVSVGFLLGAAGAFALARHTVHTQAGADAREYLAGVRMFIEVAEADRIRVLQSASGAERREVDGLAVIHLYERLLPYAMLFKLESEWTRALETRYSMEPGYVPYWYPGLAAHGIAALPSTLSRYTESLSSAVSYTSSSAGGSTGGGFAGGGGGGGFSGGR